MNHFISSKQLAEKEDKICKEIQTVVNILDAFEQAEADGREMEKHKALKEKLENDLAVLLPKLRKVRAEMGARGMMLQEIASAVIRSRLETVDAE